MPTQRHNASLAQAVEFSSEDLVPNRRGELSPVQLHKLVVLRGMFVDDLHGRPPQHLPSITRSIIVGFLAGLLHLLDPLDRLRRWLDAGYRPLPFRQDTPTKYRAA